MAVLLRSFLTFLKQLFFKKISVHVETSLNIEMSLNIKISLNIKKSLNIKILLAEKNSLNFYEFRY